MQVSLADRQQTRAFRVQTSSFISPSISQEQHSSKEEAFPVGCRKNRKVSRRLGVCRIRKEDGSIPSSSALCSLHEENVTSLVDMYLT